MPIILENQEGLVLNTTNMTEYQICERIGRTCYKSEDLIDEDSATKFVTSLYKNGHHAMLEFGQIYLNITSIMLISVLMKYMNPFITESLFMPFRFQETATGVILVGSFRAFHDWFKFITNSRDSDKIWYCEVADLLDAIATKYPEIFASVKDECFAKLGDDFDKSPECEGMNPDDIIYPFEFLTRERMLFMANPHESQSGFCLSNFIICKFTTVRGVTHELVRHRPCSYAMESTRYCNYTKGKFGESITVILPWYLRGEEPDETDEKSCGSLKYQTWLNGIKGSEEAYFSLISQGCKPQEARGTLPLDLKADIWVGAYEDQWQHMLDLRYHGTTGSPHPQIKELFGIVYEDLCNASQGRLK